MNKILQNIAILVCGLIIAHNASAQQTNTMYFMDRLPQSNLYNPAYTPACTWHISPFVLFFVPTTGLAVNAPTDLDDVFNYNPETDQWEWFYHPNRDAQKFFTTLKPINQFDFESRISPLGFGFKFEDKNYIGFDWAVNTYSLTTFPTSLLEFPTKGNAEMRNADLSGLSNYTTAYQSLELTYAREINEKLNLGISAKYLNGFFNNSVAMNTFNVITAENSTEIDFETELEIMTNIPIDSITHDADGNPDGIEASELDNMNIEQLVVFPQNHGFAFDIGAVYKPEDNIVIQVGINDIGFINWTENTSVLTAEGDFSYKGIYIDDNDFQLEDMAEEIGDSLIDLVSGAFNEDLQKKSFQTNLPIKAYYGAEYRYDETLGVGLMGKTRKYKEHWNTSITAILNLRVFTYGAVALSYSMKNRSMNSIGIATTLRLGPIQWYFATDNALGAIIYQNSRNFSLNMGANLVFGRKKSYNYPKNLPFIDVN